MIQKKEKYTTLTVKKESNNRNKVVVGQVPTWTTCSTNSLEEEVEALVEDNIISTLVAVEDASTMVAIPSKNKRGQLNSSSRTQM